MKVSFGLSTKKSRSSNTSTDPYAGQSVLVLKALDMSKQRQVRRIEFSKTALESLGIAYGQGGKFELAVISKDDRPDSIQDLVLKAHDDSSDSEVAPEAIFKIGKNNSTSSEPIYSWLVERFGLENLEQDNVIDLEAIDYSNVADCPLESVWFKACMPVTKAEAEAPKEVGFEAEAVQAHIEAEAQNDALMAQEAANAEAEVEFEASMNDQANSFE